MARWPDDAYVVLEPADDGDTFVNEDVWTATGRLKEQLAWQLVGTRPSRWRIAHTSEAWPSWNTMATRANVSTGPEIEAAAADVVAEVTGARRSLIAVMAADGTHGRRGSGCAVATVEMSDDDVDWEEAARRPYTAHYYDGNPTSNAWRLAHKAGVVVRLETRGGRYPTAGAWPCWEPGGTYTEKCLRRDPSETRLIAAHNDSETFQDVTLPVSDPTSLRLDALDREQYTDWVNHFTNLEGMDQEMIELASALNARGFRQGFRRGIRIRR